MVQKHHHDPQKSTANMIDIDNESVKSKSSNEESREFEILFNVGDKLIMLSTNVKDKLAKIALVFRVWNPQLVLMEESFLHTRK